MAWACVYSYTFLKLAEVTGRGQTRTYDTLVFVLLLPFACLPLFVSSYCATETVKMDVKAVKKENMPHLGSVYMLWEMCEGNSTPKN